MLALAISPGDRLGLSARALARCPTALIHRGHRWLPPLLSRRAFGALAFRRRQTTECRNVAAGWPATTEGDKLHLDLTLAGPSVDLAPGGGANDASAGHRWLVKS